MSDFEISVVGGASAPSRVHSEPRPDLFVGPPPDFGGSASWWSPEHLLVAAFSTCFDATFRDLAKRARLPVRELTCRAYGSVGKTPDGLRFTGIHLAVDVEVDRADSATAHAVLADAEKHCIVKNALAVPVRIASIVTLATAA
jgi:organic hydroperoxide reductase OsmC/OhrA